MDNKSIEIDTPLPKQVYLQCVFLKILKIDTINEVYSAEIFLQAKWREPLLDKIDDNENLDLSSYWNPKLSISNVFSENKTSVSQEIVFPNELQEAYIVEKKKVRAIFQETLELQHFPFDCQDLSITVVTDIQDIELLECPHDKSKLNIIDGMDSQEWSLFSHVQVQSKITKNHCTIGAKDRQVMVFTCRAARQFAYFIINNFMISSMFYLLTFTSFAIPVTNVFGRLSLCTIILLTSVTFKVAVSQNLPKIPYLTYLDKTILGNIIMIMITCIWHALTSLWFLKLQATEALSALSTIETGIIPGILIFYVITILVFALTIYFDAGKRRRKMKEKDIDFHKTLDKCIVEKSSCDFY